MERPIHPLVKRRPHCLAAIGGDTESKRRSHKPTYESRLKMAIVIVQYVTDITKNTK
jgi:hypothetical protein